MTTPEPLPRALLVVTPIETTDGSTFAATSTYDPGLTASTATGSLPDPTVTVVFLAGASSRPANTPPTAPTSEQDAASSAMPANRRRRGGSACGGAGGGGKGGGPYGLS